MPNPFRQVGNMPNMNNLRQMYQIFKSRGNPMQLFNNAIKENPKLKPIMEAFGSGQKPEDVFRKLCQERNIDPNEFIKNITG